MSKVLYVQRKDYLAHHGVKGQKWGVRRYEDEYGNLTEAGRKRYSGKKGLGKYLYDNNPKAQLDSNRAGRGLSAFIGLAAAGASKGNAITYTINGNQHTTYSGLGKYGTAGAVGQIAVGAITAVAAQTAMSAINRNMRYTTMEYVESSNEEIRNARNYLRSQGINV